MRRRLNLWLVKASSKVVAVGDTAVADLGAIVGALGTALVLVGRGRLAVLGGLAAVAVAEALLGLSLVDDVGTLGASGAQLALLVAGGALAVAVAFFFVRCAPLVPVALLLAAPFRMHVSGGGDEGSLLVPLYATLAAAALALAFRAVRDDDLPVLPRALAVPIALFVGFAGLSLLWSQDVRTGTIRLAFILFPLALLVALVARTPYRDWLPRALAVTFVAMTSAFALYGLLQLWTRELPFAPKVELSNARTPFFRVTAIFNDPSVYGKHLAAGIAVLLAALWLGRVGLALGIGVAGLLFAGLVVSYSQSSFVALFVATAWIVVVTGGRRARRLVVGAAAAAVVGAAVLAAAALAGSSAKKVTSDRSRRVELTARVYKAHPVVGVGLGAQPLETQHVAVRKGPVPRFVSHTTPLTVAAELGTIGVLLYGLLLAAAIAAVARVRRRDAAVGIALGATLLALFVHSLFYSGFFEDPVTWFALGLAAAYLAAPRPFDTAATAATA